MPARKLTGFPPIARRDARVLVLGSMPSVLSLRDHEYYAHPQNLFWQLMGEMFGAGRELPYAERTARLLRAGVALWDVAHRCRRELSADATMRDVEPNDIAGLVARCPRIAAVCLNGRKAEQLYRRLVLPRASAALAAVPCHVLPSTSPANAALRIEAKREAWRIVLRLARDPARDRALPRDHARVAVNPAPRRTRPRAPRT